MRGDRTTGEDISSKHCSKFNLSARSAKHLFFGEKVVNFFTHKTRFYSEVRQCATGRRSTRCGAVAMDDELASAGVDEAR